MVDRGRARVLGQHRKAAGAQVKLCDRAVAALTGAQRGIRVQKTTKVVNLCAEAVDSRRESAARDRLGVRCNFHGEGAIGVSFRIWAACKKSFFKVLY